MKVTYEEFMNMIPEDTKKYVRLVFMYLNYYVKNNKALERNSSNYRDFKYFSDFGDTSMYKSKLLLSTFIGLSLDAQMSSIVCKYGFDRSKLVISESLTLLSEQKEKEIFDTCNDLFCFYNDYTKYSTLLPIDIASNVLRITSNEVQNKLFSFLGVESNVKNNIRQSSVETHVRLDTEREISIYENLPYDTVSYIETASKIRSILIDKLSRNEIRENEYIKKDDTYLVPVSLLLAIYEYDKEDKNSIEKYLVSQKIDLKGIYEKIGINLSYDIKNTSRNLESIELVYEQYWMTGTNKDKQNKDIRIVDIVNNLFDRYFTKSIVIEKILNDAKKSIGDFSNMNEKIALYESLDENSELETEIKNFYSMINKDTKEFIIFSCKAYQILLKKMKLGKHNKEILMTEDDADSLAVYIASHFYKTDIDSFYNYYGVTFDKVMKLLNIEITKEEIEQEVLDKSMLLSKFKRFVVEGVNYRNNSENVTINDVSFNLCNRNFNESMIMENIFEEIRRDINLPDDFFNMLKDFIEKQEKEIRYREKEEYFKSLPIEDLNYLTSVCQVYNGLIRTTAKDKYCDEILVVLSLLLGLNNLKDDKTKELFKNIGISFDLIYSYFGISNRVDGTLDINLLKTKFNKFIYEGRNKGNNSPGIQDIALNIFNEELYKSTELVEYLYKLGLSYDTFKNPKKLVEEYEKKLQEDEVQRIQMQKNENAKRMLGRYTQDSIVFVNNAVKNYNRLIGIYRKDKEKYKEISSEEDVEILSFILALLESDMPQTKVFVKHNLNKEKILEYLGLPINYQNEPLISEHENTLANVFFKYFQNTGWLVSTLSNSEFYLKIINKFVKNVAIFETELKTGKNYEESLTISERIKLIKESPIERLNLTSMSNVLGFGSDLELHTTYIQDEYPKLMSSNEVSTATEEIKKLVNSVYSETEVVVEPKSFFQKLFGSTDEIKKEVRINADVISSLRPNIDIQIEKLRAEAEKLTGLKEYMEEYYKKNKEYIRMLELGIEELKKELPQISKEDIFRISDLGSYIKVLENKLETLKVTDVLIGQEYVKINQVIVNHCITINSLLMSKNTLLPLIGAEMFIGSGINAEKDGMDVTKNILTLLNDIISQDVVGSKEVLEKLESMNISREQLLVLVAAANEQIKQITAAKAMESGTIYTTSGGEEVLSDENVSNISLDVNKKRVLKR